MTLLPEPDAAERGGLVPTARCLDRRRSMPNPAMRGRPAAFGLAAFADGLEP